MAYRIRTVAEITGIPRNTLIAWERRYGFVAPPRHGNGYRSYSDEDVANLLRVKNALGAGLKISEAIALLKHQKAEHTPLPALEGDSGSSNAVETSARHSALCEQLVAALTAYDAREAGRLLAQLISVPFEARVHGVFFPVLRKIGDLWESGAINVAQEHFASGIIRDQLVSILIGVGTRDAASPHAVCTTFPDELHEIGALALGVHLGLRGYRVSYLGANLPLVDMIDFCKKQTPRLACVSVIGAFERPELEDYGRKLRAAAPPTMRLVIGGVGVALDPPLEVEGVEYVPNWHEFKP